MTLAAASWWTDWPKFLPGWLAFAWTLGTGARKVWLRSHKVALGAADNELREALKTARTLFEDITSQGRRTVDWFQAAERRETSRTIRDLADRRKDRILCQELKAVADAWDKAFAVAPPMRVSDWFPNANLSPQVRQERESDQQRFAEQVSFTQTGLDHLTAALGRLNELERRTLGR
ncbi:hypothetical protein [Streptomyces sp. TP-A0356]|uniref:hypothetical protein n=1 Tax=Streptomyces sp. TP-A0356 TaxID=1359208 RepID=UPI0006E1821B|nr:hypothetical protein [Streptomyces sp. TP-A0356]